MVENAEKGLVMEGEAIVYWYYVHALPDGQQCSADGAAAVQGVLY